MKNDTPVPDRVLRAIYDGRWLPNSPRGGGSDVVCIGQKVGGANIVWRLKWATVNGRQRGMLQGSIAGVRIESSIDWSNVDTVAARLKAGLEEAADV